MPFRSEAQRSKFAAMVAAGKMSQETFDRWQAETGDTKLPERLSKPKPSLKKASAQSASAGRYASRGGRYQ